MKPLSEQLAELSVRAKNTETAFAAAQKEARDKIEARKVEALSAAKTAVEKMSQQIKSVGESASSDRQALQAKITADVNTLKAHALQATHDIKAHVAEGNLTEARHCYHAYHDLVHRELGVAPSDEFSTGLGISEVRLGRATLAVDALPAPRWFLPLRLDGLANYRNAFSCRFGEYAGCPSQARCQAGSQDAGAGDFESRRWIANRCSPMDR